MVWAFLRLQVWARRQLRGSKALCAHVSHHGTGRMNIATALVCQNK